MSQFTKPLVVTPLADGNTWLLREEFAYYVGENPQENLVLVPVGFVTDFATVPVFMRWYINSWGKHGNAAVIHDWLYWQQAERSGYSRAEADQIFLDGMLVLGVGQFRRHLIYWAVRLFGGWAWRRARWDRKDGFKRVFDEIPSKYSTELGRMGIIKRTLLQ
ncbi:MAG: DUF1353 domain-containing protein, partial [Granulosicoccaceae bacterium]